MSNDEEKKLIKEAKDGSKEAFNKLMETYRQDILNVAIRMVEDHDAALDITQDTFLKAYENIEDFRMESSFYTWIYKIAMNLSMNFNKRQKFLKPLEWLGIKNSNPKKNLVEENFLKDIAKKEKLERIRQAVQKLPEKTKAVFNLRYYEGMEFEKIAKILENKPSTIRVQYSQAIDKLKDYFSEQ